MCEAAAGEFGAQPSRAKVREVMAALAKADPAAGAGDGRIDREAIFQYLFRSAAPFVVAADIAPGSAAAPALFGLIDANHDGQLSRAELAGAAARLVVRDFDDDGLISERELIVDPTQHAERTTEEDTVAQTFTQGRHADLDRARNDQLPAPAAAIVRRYDRDGDGKLLVVGAGESLELTLAAEAVRRLDASGDGLLDAAELESLRHRADRNRSSPGVRHGRFGGPGVCHAARQVERIADAQEDRRRLQNLCRRRPDRRQPQQSQSAAEQRP